MKDTTRGFLLGVAAIAVPVLCFGLWRSVHSAEWLICNIKNPGKSAIFEIQADLDAGRFDVAKQKVHAFAKSWEEFSSDTDSWSGRGIMDVPIIFLGMSGTGGTTNVKPVAAPNERQ